MSVGETTDSLSNEDGLRNEKGRFVCRGGPGGRPAVAKEFREKCKGFMEEEGWPLLMAIARDAEAKDSRYALELIAAYAYGKPKLGLEVTGEDGGPVNWGVIILPAVKSASSSECGPTK